ncbi:methionine ABC transporter substrate-binding protein [Campylobacter sp. FMV-PI01]|uniref:Methionine ABC transporter substrate-binding protein n=1 Tax=Campylobacter portucalensis TaxID=2608384 RepID=A0A6L5WI69_9BACT|nr:MetQ/NlpA family ABC transporter substrate-binding protein [Campylobacter portucalensis]MSN96819.1 methionine ABC transporter substrate-binding protein [Campylobacter portucalensis]
MKSIIKTSILSLILSLNLSAKTIHVGAVPVPHAEILEVVKPLLKEKGYTLQITEMDDKILNQALNSGDIDANFYQHKPYLDEFNKEHKTDLVELVGVHIEPMTIYSKKIKNLKELKNGSKVSIPNDPINEKRALILLDKAGLIKFDAKNFIITKNDKNLKIITLLAATLPRSIDDVDISIISTSYALAGGLDPKIHGLFVEDKDSPYINIVAIKRGNLGGEKFEALKKALNSDKVRDFIEKTYKNSVIPAF